MGGGEELSLVWGCKKGDQWLSAQESMCNTWGPLAGEAPFSFLKGIRCSGFRQDLPGGMCALDRQEWGRAIQASKEMQPVGIQDNFQGHHKLEKE